MTDQSPTSAWLAVFIWTPYLHATQRSVLVSTVPMTFQLDYGNTQYDVTIIYETNGHPNGAVWVGGLNAPCGIPVEAGSEKASGFLLLAARKNEAEAEAWLASKKIGLARAIDYSKARLAHEELAEAIFHDPGKRASYFHHYYGQTAAGIPRWKAHAMAMSVERLLLRPRSR
ncbi:MAG: hypothetical protein WCO25_02730 [Candidatus Uhrbacteria bacterium]